MAGIVDDIYKRLNKPPIPQTNYNVAGGAGPASMTSTGSYSALVSPSGSIFGTSTYVPPAAPTGNTPLARAYESLWSSNPNSIQLANSAPMSAPPAVPSLATSGPFQFSDGSGESGIGGRGPALMSSGGLDRGGALNEAKQRVALDDYQRRISTLAARNIYRDVAGGGGVGTGRSSRVGGNQSKRIFAEASPARETIDQRTNRAMGEVVKDQIEAQKDIGVFDKSLQGLSDLSAIEKKKADMLANSEGGKLTASEIDKKIKELEDMKKGL